MYKGPEIRLGSEQYFLDSNIHNFFVIIQKRILKLYLTLEMLP